MAIKNPPPAPKHPAGQNVHPETKHAPPSTGVPGTKSSQAKQTGPEPRNVNDKDGNEQQAQRAATKP
jgi:hypothetical protein